MALPYLSFESYDGKIKEIDLKLMKLVSADTYDERMVQESVLKIGYESCCGIALQLAIIGFGQKSYNKCLIKDKEIDIKSFFDLNKISYQSKLNDKIDPGALTPRRLIRFFRFHIGIYLETNKSSSSYLFRKYCPVVNDETRSYIYPGYEHQVETKNLDNARMLYYTYLRLDEKLGTKISERIKRVLLARGFSLEFFTKCQENYKILGTLK